MKHQNARCVTEKDTIQVPGTVQVMQKKKNAITATTTRLLDLSTAPPTSQQAESTHLRLPMLLATSTLTITVNPGVTLIAATTVATARSAVGSCPPHDADVWG